MSLPGELRYLNASFERLTPAIKLMLGEAGSPMHVLDWITIGAIKRTLSLAGGLSTMIGAKNMIRSRAILRMQLDKVSRFLAYTDVDDPEALERAVTKGLHLKNFKFSYGNKLTDAYLVDRLSQEHPWARHIYASTSGYVRFSERQFFDSIHPPGSDEDRTFRLKISHVDSKFPELSWTEVASCFNRVTQIFASTHLSYAEHKEGLIACSWH